MTSGILCVLFVFELKDGENLMANTKSAKKRIKVTEVKTLRNQRIKSALKSLIKKFELSLENKNIEAATSELNELNKALDMAAHKGVLHRNKASRKKSRLAIKLNNAKA